MLPQEHSRDFLLSAVRSSLTLPAPGEGREAEGGAWSVVRVKEPSTGEILCQEEEERERPWSRGNGREMRWVLHQLAGFNRRSEPTRQD